MVFGWCVILLTLSPAINLYLFTHTYSLLLVVVVLVHIILTFVLFVFLLNLYQYCCCCCTVCVYCHSVCTAASTCRHLLLLQLLLPQQQHHRQQHAHRIVVNFLQIFSTKANAAIVFVNVKNTAQLPWNAIGWVGIYFLFDLLFRL